MAVDRRFPKRNEPKHKINNAIRHPEVRVNTTDGDSVVMTIGLALQMARDEGLDLVEIAPNAKPPVCRIVDYGKFLYDQKRREKKPEQQEVKELRFTPTTDDHDVAFKVKHARNWLEQGDKVKCVLQFRGREMTHRELGEKKLLEVYQLLEDVAKPESLPKLEGKKMFMTLSPKKKGGG